MVLVTDEQARGIQRALAGGLHGGLVPITWREQLLEDPGHRIRIARVLVDSRRARQRREPRPARSLVVE
jgi:hypothetical protein